MDCITGILTGKIFALTEGDIMCQSSSQRADRQASTPFQHHSSKVWFGSIPHFTALEPRPWANTPRVPLKMLLVQMEWVTQGRVGRNVSLKMVCASSMAQEELSQHGQLMSHMWGCSGRALVLVGLCSSRGCTGCPQWAYPSPWHHLQGVPQGKKGIAKSFSHHQPLEHPQPSFLTHFSFYNQQKLLGLWLKLPEISLCSHACVNMGYAI